MPYAGGSLRREGYISAHRRERIEAAVIAGGRHVSGPHEAWIAADPFRGGVKVLITGPHGLERTVTFALDDIGADAYDSPNNTP